MSTRAASARRATQDRVRNLSRAELWRALSARSAIRADFEAHWSRPDGLSGMACWRAFSAESARWSTDSEAHTTALGSFRWVECLRALSARSARWSTNSALSPSFHSDSPTEACTWICEVLPALKS